MKQSKTTTTTKKTIEKAIYLVYLFDYTFI